MGNTTQAREFTDGRYYRVTSDAIAKSQNVCSVRVKQLPPLQKKISFRTDDVCVYAIITLNPQVSNIFYYLCKKENMKSYKKQIDMGLSIEGGRLINERPDGMTGIQLAAKMKRARKRMDKVDMIAEGNEMARMRRDMRDMFKK